MRSLKKQAGFLQFLSAAAPIIGAVAGGLIGKKGASDQNAASAFQAQQQMDFQERMSNTAHQREVTDLRAAGLNPILSGTGGMGASSPGGAAAPVVNELGAAVDSGAKAAGAVNQSMINKAQIDNLNAQTKLTSAQAQMEQAKTDYLLGEKYGDGKNLMQKAEEAKAFREVALEESAKWRPRLDQDEWKLLQEKIRVAQATGRNIEADTKYTNVNTAIESINLKYTDARNKAGLAGEVIGSALGLKNLAGSRRGLRR